MLLVVMVIGHGLLINLEMICPHVVTFVFQTGGVSHARQSQTEC
jgi:hypothetical protein